MITVYATTTCPRGQQSVDFFRARGINFDVKDAVEYKDEVFEKAGCLTSPIIDIDGRLIIGFNEIDMSKALEDDSKNFILERRQKFARV